jgi:hypothetical protein
MRLYYGTVNVSSYIVFCAHLPYIMFFVIPLASSPFCYVLCKYFSLPSLLLQCMLDSYVFYRSLNRLNVSSYCRCYADLDTLGHPSANQNTLMIGCMNSLSLLPVAAIWRMPCSDLQLLRNARKNAS